MTALVRSLYESNVYRRIPLRKHKPLGQFRDKALLVRRFLAY